MSTRPEPAVSPVIVVAAAAALLSLAMGLRQSLGLFTQPLTTDLGIDVAEFTLAIAVQNLAWGVFQPLAGGLVPRLGFRNIMLIGAALYITGLLGLSMAWNPLTIFLTAGLCIGPAMGFVGTAITMSVASRAVSPQRRSLTLGIISAAGSAGTLYAAPLGQTLTQMIDWRAAMTGFAILAALMIPAAILAGRIDRQPLPTATPGGSDSLSGRDALKKALSTPPFVIMAAAYFVCGMQLIFLTTHLPSYLAICGMDPMLGAQALALIGFFNILGSLFFGWAGGRWNKMVLLGMIYLCRSLILAWYFHDLPTPQSTLLFAALMGFLWLGVGPLVAGSVAEMFGLRWQAMIQGLAFMSHQFGSFAGAFGGGWLYDHMGNYTLAWQLGVGLGLFAGIVQIATALATPRPPAPAPA
ncbi:MFS transporter [Pseudooceanicola sp. C21-150M6]|uniref:MFS transporter n=1 Tax=Pseudooceanicola sp. C21-150M6 TaxID=3434355 RepID=UPI003D7F3045